MSLHTTTTAAAARLLASASAGASSSSSASSSLALAAAATTVCAASSRRSFSASATASAKPRRGRSTADDPMTLRKTPKFNYDDVPTLGHQILNRKREMLQYLRTIEHEIPKLEALRQPYTPPKPSQLLRFRFQHYQGEAHPASRKVVLNVSVQQLFTSGLLKSEQAKHNFLVLAGPRFHRSAPVELNLDGVEDLQKVQGEVTISCERMPNERQNMKWCSDTFDALLQEANKANEELASIPLDPRPDLVREAKKRAYARKDKTKLRDFPKEWLPSTSSPSSSSSSSSSSSA